jgi:hypothetical protein
LFLNTGDINEINNAGRNTLERTGMEVVIMENYATNLTHEKSGYGRSRLRKWTFWAAVIPALVLVWSAGCNNGKPRMRFGSFFGSPGGMKFIEPGKIGKHHYGFTLNEIVGMAYTCKGGFVDIGHLREAADRTAYLKTVAYQAIIEKKPGFSFSLIEPSRYHVKLSYPENWDDLSEQERKETANEVSIQLGQYLGHTSLIWHEILSWYGFATLGIFPDTISAFSWEDPYSDVLGTHISVKALRSGNQYNESMTELISETLEELEVQPAEVARRAAESIEGRWYTGGFYFFVEMKKRNFDVGLDDGSITPWLVPGICPDAEPVPCPAPSLESIRAHGFDIRMEMDMRVMEKAKICRSIGLDSNSRLRPAVHFAQILDYIKKRYNEKYNPESEDYAFSH